MILSVSCRSAPWQSVESNENMTSTVLHIKMSDIIVRPVNLLKNIDLPHRKKPRNRMQSFLAAMPNDLENKTEKHYQTIIYLIFSLLGYYIRTEEKSAIGRADAVCWTDNSIYVFEFKVDSSAETALKQIDDKGYMIPFRFEDGKRLVKVGVNISTVSRTLEDWKIDVVNA